MRDCENVEMRDRLPELLHERLVPADRARVLAHVASCADCSDELSLLRSARAAVDAGTPRIDTGRIAAAVRSELAVARGPRLPLVVEPELAAAAAGDPRRARSPRPRVWVSGRLRAAAAFVVMALGAGGVLVARSNADHVAPAQGAAISAPAHKAPSLTEAPQPAPERPPQSRTPRAEVAAQPASSALGATFSDLTDDELAAVIQAVDGTDRGVPAEPAPTPAVITPGDLL